MSRKTKRLRHHKTNRRHKNRHYKTNRKNMKKTKKHNISKRKQKKIFTISGNKGISLFTSPDKKYTQKIIINSLDPSANQSGNMIMGLRTMGLKNV